MNNEFNNDNGVFLPLDFSKDITSFQSDLENSPWIPKESDRNGMDNSVKELNVERWENGVMTQSKMSAPNNRAAEAPKITPELIKQLELAGIDPSILTNLDVRNSGNNNGNNSANNSGNINFTGIVVLNLDGSEGLDQIISKFTDLLVPKQVSIVADPATATEADMGGNPTNFTITRTGDTTKPLTVKYTTSGKAIDGIDFQKLPGTVTIPANENQVVFPLNVIDDTISEYAEPVVLNIAANDEYIFGKNPSATVNVADNDQSIVSMKAIDSNGAETESGKIPNSGKFKIRRAGDLTNPLTVSYTVGGTATHGSDYELPSTVTIPAGMDRVDLEMKILDDLTFEGKEAVKVALSPSNSYKIAKSAHSGTVKIADND
jgi:hypothetical protein